MPWFSATLGASIMIAVTLSGFPPAAKTQSSAASPDCRRAKTAAGHCRRTDRRRTQSWADELPRVHQVAGIERALDAAHQFDLDRRFVMGDLLAFHDADPVLGADRAVQVAHNAMDNVVELLPAPEIGRYVGALGLG